MNCLPFRLLLMIIMIKIGEIAATKNGLCFIITEFAFLPSTIFKNLPFKIDRQNYTLNKDQEELIYSWTKKKDTHYVQDPVFQQNFLTDFKKLLPKDTQNNLHDIDQLDMSEFMTFVDGEKATKERDKIAWGNLSLEERKKIALEKKREGKIKKLLREGSSGRH